MERLKTLVRGFFADSSGQGITEYGAIIAFVSCLVAVLFAMTSPSLYSALSQSHSSVTAQISDLNQRATQN